MKSIMINSINFKQKNRGNFSKNFIPGNRHERISQHPEKSDACEHLMKRQFEIRQNHHKRSDLKIFRNGDPVGLRLNMVKSAQPSSAKCAFHKPFKYTSYTYLNCQLYFFLCM